MELNRRLSLAASVSMSSDGLSSESNLLGMPLFSLKCLDKRRSPESSYTLHFLTSCHNDLQEYDLHFKAKWSDRLMGFLLPLLAMVHLK